MALFDPSSFNPQTFSGVNGGLLGLLATLGKVPLHFQGAGFPQSSPSPAAASSFAMAPAPTAATPYPSGELAMNQLMPSVLSGQSVAPQMSGSPVSSASSGPTGNILNTLGIGSSPQQQGGFPAPPINPIYRILDTLGLNGPISLSDRLAYQQQLQNLQYEAYRHSGLPEGQAILATLNPAIGTELAKPTTLAPGAKLVSPLGGSPQSPQKSQSNGSTISENDSGVMGDTEARMLAERYVLGDSKALPSVGMGSGYFAVANRNKVLGMVKDIMAERHLTPTDVSANAMKFAGLDKNMGDIYKTNNALNTGVQHLTQLAEVFQNLGNSNFQPSNYVKNLLGPLVGATGPTNYAAVVNRVAPEITRIWRGAGGAEQDIERDLATLKNANTPAQGFGAIANIAGLMTGKIKSNQYQFESVFGPGSAKFMMSPENSSGIQKLEKQSSGESQQFVAPPGWLFSKKGQVYKDPQGNIYDKSGKMIKANGPAT